MKRQLLFTALAMALAQAPCLRADAVLDWNAIANTTILAGGRPGPTALIDYAIVHAAIHDAVQAYEKRFDAYATIIPNATGSMDAAVAKATRDLLVNRFNAQATTVDNAYTSYLATHGILATDPGIAVGAQVASEMIALRANDGAFPASFPPFTGSTAIGMWRPTPSLLPGNPPSLSPMAAPWGGGVTPFVIPSAEQFMAPAPVTVKSGRYVKDYNEVKALGSLTSTVRTPEQTQIAYLWADNFLAQANRLFRGLAESELDNSGDRARLLALAYMAGTDAFIATWAGKSTYPTWRPITAIREGQNDGNKHTVGDSAWQPLINTPNYPDHSSGANALVSGYMKMLALFFGTDKMTFTVTSANPNANPAGKTYHSFKDAALDVVEARILQGIHFRSADRVGRKLGLSVSRWVYANALRPIGDSGGEHCDEEDEEDEE
jgi:hypothetical protein